MAANSLTQDFLKYVLRYDPDTGLFAWLISPNSTTVIGKIAGCTTCYGYVVIKINHKIYRAHRLAWLYMYGEWPEGQIDHINHQRDDNRVINLRSATQQMNGRNQKHFRNNTSGFMGVDWNKRGKKWRASIKTNRKRIHLGTFLNKEDAINARKAANIKYGYHENHGLPATKSV